MVEAPKDREALVEFMASTDWNARRTETEDQPLGQLWGDIREEWRDEVRAEQRRMITTLEAAGMRIVPVEPSPRMTVVAADGNPATDDCCDLGYAIAIDDAAEGWGRMLAASPYAPEKTP